MFMIELLPHSGQEIAELILLIRIESQLLFPPEIASSSSSESSSFFCVNFSFSKTYLSFLRTGIKIVKWVYENILVSTFHEVNVFVNMLTFSRKLIKFLIVVSNYNTH